MFGPGIGLRIRMFVALALNAVLLLVLLAIAVALFMQPDGWSIVALFVMFALAGFAGSRTKPKGGRADPDDVRRAERALSRLAVVADMPEPRLSEAVLAHELSHIANHDATVMTVLAAPGVFVLRGLSKVWRDRETPFRAKPGLVMFACIIGPPALVSAALARIVSRHRELAADRGAALLTGSPAAMASALAELSGGLGGFPKRDLRAAAARDLLHVVPARPAQGLRRLWATHPPLKARLRELERLESRLQGENLTVMTSPSAMT
jgi:hypothetical protein